MQLKTILNRVQKFKSFVYADVRWIGGTESPELRELFVRRAHGLGKVKKAVNLLDDFE